MGVTMTWFKDYNVMDVGYMKIIFIDSGEYDFCYKNANILMKIFGEIKCIPRIGDFLNEEKLTVLDVKERIYNELISPSDMVEICNILLNNTFRYIRPHIENNKSLFIDMVEYIAKIRDLSEQGYYIVFEND